MEQCKPTLCSWIIVWLLTVWNASSQNVSPTDVTSTINTPMEWPDAADVIHKEAKSGRHVELPCPSANGSSATNKINWYKTLSDNKSNQSLIITLDFSNPNDKQVKNHVNGDIYSVNNSSLSLTIQNIDLQYSGYYVCEVIQIQKQNNTDGIKETSLFKDVIELVVIAVPSPPPGIPTAKVIDARSLLISWTPSVETNNSPIKKYEVICSSTSQNTTHPSIGNKTTDFKALRLLPYTKYSVRIRAENEAGYSNYSQWSEPVMTSQSLPHKDAYPTITKVLLTSESIYLEYKPPRKELINGILLGYGLKYAEEPQPLEPVTYVNQTFTNDTVYNITNLEPFKTYIVNISVTNMIGDGPAKMKYYTTEEDFPGKPVIYNIARQTSSSFEVRWAKPAKPNGKIRYYEVYLDGTFKGNISTFHDYEEIYTYDITNLVPESHYKVEICAATSKGCGRSSEPHTAHTDVEIPRMPEILNVSSNSTTGIVVKWKSPLNMDSSRNIKYYMIFYDLLSSDGNVITKNKLLVPIQTHRLNYESYLEGLNANHRYSVAVAAGTDSIIISKKVLWGESSRQHYISLMSLPVPTTRPEPRKSTAFAIVIGILIPIIFVLMIVLAILLVRKRWKDRQEYVEVVQDVDIVPIPSSYSETPPKRESLPTEEFESHVLKNHADGDLGFSQEFDDINQNTRTDLSSKHSLEQENKHKNRYINILAYDHSRVILKPMLASSHSDYINGNFIEGYEKPRAYIATQGPLPPTFSDFWRMVWEQNSAVIIMITNLTEKGRRKCDEYWPHEGEHVYNNVLVKLEEENITAHYITRKFKVKHFKERMTLKKRSNVEREVLQFHFTEWPDHGVPNYCLPVLQFIFKSVAAIPENTGPAVIHCSAGVGRTGTYIVIDTMMKQIMAKRTVNVFSFLSHIRNQRNYMVQTEDQYVFIHDVLVEYIQGGETEIKDFTITQYVKDLIKRRQVDGSLLEKQFKLVTAYKPKDFHLTTSKMAVNKEKIRSEHILPEERSRVKLPMKPGIQGSDYINASYFQGYNKTQEYIVTQHPLINTVEDFWRMVWDHNCMTVVLLSEVKVSDNDDEEDYIEFWPHKDEDTEYGHFQISFVGEQQKGNLTFRDFLLQSTQDDYECTTRIISTTDSWPGSCTPLHTAFELVDYVKQCHNQHEVEGPIVVVDRFGGKEAAIFCALSTLKDQIEREHYIDVYITAKLYHLKRPGVFSSIDNRAECDGEQPTSCLDDYLYLYRCIESYYTELLGPSTDGDSGIGNGTHPVHPYHGSLTKDSDIPMEPIPMARSPEKMPPPAVVRSMSRNSTLLRGSGGGGNAESTA